MKDKYDILPLWVVVLCCLFVACGNEGSKHYSEGGSTVVNANTQTDVDTSSLLSSVLPSVDEPTYAEPINVDIPIAINITHDEDFFPNRYWNIAYKVVKDSENDIYIEPDSKYYEDYTSGHRFSVPEPAMFYESETVEFLNLSMDIVNNTKKKLDISELNVVVDNSHIDKSPLIFICTSEECCNTIHFANESYFNWGGFTFNYSILKQGETFNGKYKKHKHIPYFRGKKSINLLPDLIEMGYDYNKVVNYLNEKWVKEGGNEETLYEPYPAAVNSCSTVALWLSEKNSDFNFLKDAFKPFELKEIELEPGVYNACARLYGNLVFDKTGQKVDFTARIFLSTLAEFGAASYGCDKFDIRLKSEGEAYTLRYPYTTVIEPGGTEFVKLTFIADKSSMHSFHIEAKNNNGLSIRSKDIHYHHYKPRY